MIIINTINDIAIKALSVCVLFFSAAVCVADLLDDATISAIDTQLNTSNWAASNVIDRNNSTRWLSNKQANDINFMFGSINEATCFDSFDLVNYGSDDRSVSRFALFKTLDNSLQNDTDTLGWIPIVADSAPSGLIDYLSWVQGGRITAIDSQLNTSSWAGEHINDGDSASRWLSNKSNNTLVFAFDTDWDGSTGDAININELTVYNYGADDRSVSSFQIEVTADGNDWHKLEVPGSMAGEADFNFALLQQGASLANIDSQLNTISWAAENIHDGDTNSRWLSNKANNTLVFTFDVDSDGVTSASGDIDDVFTIEEIYLRNYGVDDRSVRQFQVEYRTRSDNQWQKIPVPGSVAGAVDFSFLLALHGAQLAAIDSQLNSSNWGADNLHDGDINSRWLSNKSNNTLDFTVDVDGDGVTGAEGDNDDVFTIEKVYLQNYGNDDRSVRQFQVEVKTQSNTDWHKIAVPASFAGQAGYNFALSVQGGQLDMIDSQLNNTRWGADNIHDGDINSRWLSNKPINTLAFSFDTDLNGNNGDGINFDTLELVNYGVDDRSIQTFEVDIQSSGGAWQTINAPGGGTAFTASMDSNGQSWVVGPFVNISAVRIRTLSNHGDPSYTGARELRISGTSVGPGYTFTASMNNNGETFTLDMADRPVGVTDVRFRSISNHGDPTYTGAREFSVLGTSITRNHTFTAAMHSNGETFTIDRADLPRDVTQVRLLTISNHGDASYTGAREFGILGPSIIPSHTFTLPMTVGPHTITLDNEDSVSAIIGARLITIANHGDPTYTGLRELQLRGNPVGPSYVFNAQMDSSVQTFNFPSALGTVFRFHTLGNHGDPNYTGAAELMLNASTNCTYSQWHFDENQWQGAAGEVLDSAGNHLHAMSANGASANGADPAIGGNPGTCRYGEFDGQNDYVAMPGAFPDLQNSFTVTAWIYAEDLSSGSRIFIDDENNSGGYGFSLGDGGAGRLRFFSRNVSPVSVDTQNAVINTNTWHFVAAVHDSVTRTRQIYVDGVAQVLTGNNSSPAYSGSWGTDIGVASVGGETGNAGENNADFRFRGRIDEVAVYNGALTPSELDSLQLQTHNCTDGPTINHFRIDAGSVSASTCTPATITITACATVDCSSILNNFAGTVTVSTSSGRGNWSTAARGTLSPSSDNDDNGTASYQFHSDDNGVVLMGLSNTHAETITVTVTDSGSSANSTSMPITFADNVFVITNDTVQVAGRDQAMSAALWTNDGTNCAIATGYNGTKSLKAWISRDIADPNGAAPEIAMLSLPNTLPGADNLTTLDFSNGVADFSLRTSDVGRYELNLRDDSLLFSDSVINGTSAITTRPFGLYIDVSGNPSPPANDASGPVFIGAGNNFTVAAAAVQWQAVDDSNDDGIPDGHMDNDPANNADLSNNPTTVSFGVEQNAQAELVVLTAVGVAPGGGVFDDSANAGNAPVITSFVNGSGSIATARYNEVGIIEITARLGDGNYLNGDNVYGKSGYVGRFTPDHFIVQTPVITPATGNFTYLEQPFTASFDLIAVNASGATTSNYSASFLKLSATHLNTNADYGAVDQTSAIFMNDRTTASDHIISDSAGVITVVNVDLTIAKTSRVEAPMANVQIGLALTDADAVALSVENLDTTGDAGSDKVTIGSLPGQLRYGRVFIPPVYGPDIPAFDTASQPTAWMAMPFEIQYFDGTHFIVNSDDNSTAYDRWSWTLVDNCNDGSIACDSLPANFAITLPASPASVSTGRPDISLPVTITRPGMAGDVYLGVGVDHWLRFDWDSNGSDDDPKAQVTFGTYRGHDRIIYWREKYN